MYFNSFLPKTVRDWNDLSLEIKNSDTVESFKIKLNSSITKPPKHYYDGKRLLQIQHTRLRTQCSSLNSHLHSKNIIDDPNCICGAIEDTKHYLLLCPLYTRHRLKMMEDIAPILQEEITLNILLYGSTTANYITNSSIFKIVQSYISKTKRF